MTEHMNLLMDEKFPITEGDFYEITKIVTDVKTRYTNWIDVVDDAVRVFTTWWQNPPDAEKIFLTELWPHMTPEQHNVMQDPKIGQAKVYEMYKKEAEKIHGKKFRPKEVEVDSKIQNDTKEKLEAGKDIQYSIKKIRYKKH